MKYATLLLSSPFLGVLWLVLLFLLCFFFVHFIRLAQFGQNWRKLNDRKNEEKAQNEEKNSSQENEKKTPPEPSGEPIYYIVERKRRTKSSFSEPKQIRFK